MPIEFVNFIWVVIAGLTFFTAAGCLVAGAYIGWIWVEQLAISLSRSCRARRDRDARLYEAHTQMLERVAQGTLRHEEDEEPQAPRPRRVREVA